MRVVDLSAKKSDGVVCSCVFCYLVVCAYCDFSAQYVFARAVLKFDIADTHNRFFVRLINKINFSALNHNVKMRGELELAAGSDGFLQSFEFADKVKHISSPAILLEYNLTVVN